jgi:hypothetical protein
MKYILNISLLLLLPILLSAQVRLINNGATIRVNNGVNLRANEGSITNQNSGTINNDGNIYMDLDFNQTTGASYTGGAASWLWFEGAANQNALSDATLNIARLRVDNGNRLILGNEVNVSTAVDLMSNGNIELGTFNLVMAPGATISNYNLNNYIITNSTGVLQQEVAAIDVVFPVGNSTYNPATLNNSGTTDNLTVRVDDQVFYEGTTGTLVTEDVVNRTWLIDEAVVGGSNLSMVLEWDQSEELTNFDRLNSGVAHHLSGPNWDDPTVYTTATNVSATRWSQTRSGFSSFSPFVVKDVDSDLPVELLYFDAYREDVNEVQLNWATASETNNKGFEIQRMLEHESEFKSIAWVDGQGNSTATIYYEDKDNNSYSGTSYYRLKQLDFDGSFAYSEIKAVEGQKIHQDIRIFPNPANDYINIQILESIQQAQLKLYDSKGALVRHLTIQVQPNELIRLHQLDQLPAGIYILNIQTDTGNNYTKTFERIGQ